MSYDVIIAGAGSAGCVLAARLSENPARSVLLLEAGPDYPDPAALPADIANSRRPAQTHDWQFFSEAGSLGRPMHLPRGKLVGGCSATNATVAVRGATPADYDAWETLGNAGWSFRDVLPSFKRLERDADFADEWHGQDGPLPIRRPRLAELAPLQAAFLETCVAAGYAQVADHNAPQTLGVGPWPTNGFGGVRRSVALTYLYPARCRPNLTVRSNSLVEQVIFQGRQAVGVRLAGTGEAIRGEHVILAAGAYGSPPILMRSGLGPAPQLRALGIDVLEDLPGVGQNLHDHPALAVAFAAASSDAEVPWFQVLLTARSGEPGPDHDLYILPVGPMASPQPYFTIVASLARSCSRGELRLRSADPAAAPLIDLGYFTAAGDMSCLLEGVRLARALGRLAPLSHLALAELYPGPQVTDSAADLATAIRARVKTFNHPVGTCRMGAPTDPLSVVDARGKVHAVERLSVVDASIMPAIPTAATNVPTIMVAEKCAAWLSEGTRKEEEGTENENRRVREVVFEDCL